MAEWRWHKMRSPGTTTVAPDVLMAIARLTALKVEGVQGMGAAPHEWRSKDREEGVRVSVVDNTVDADVYLVLQKDVNLRQVSHEVQTQVARAISEMVGMQAGRINIHIEDIYYPPAD